ncbi:2-hydroxychromene-2-carboxylate isomerase [Kibdelosporangium persicum]|uniref:2-hydroxychromene-2-carboxylate isomerase n=1 Tax=Kibdelosporangium persicum TaxID=2698649 RepID=A0ABX2FI87_9PSEU|nr:2-hydroxychromene-2-carboxylate isomerase [Kibdelosporangium persicum]NRN70953.1 2-hydroxychromene-2-carboxylate isomerase [Kibdelosporangium persicum]
MNGVRSVRPRFYFSLRSPYSWLAWHDLLRDHWDLAEQLDWRPFFEPDSHSSALLAAAGGRFPYTPMSKAKSLYVLQDVKRLAAERGLSFRWPVDRNPIWEVPHLAYLVAARHGRGQDFITAAARARWHEGRNVCDPAVVASWGDELGIDGSELAGAADDPLMRAQGVQALLEIQRDGVFGVPFFTLRHQKFWGVDRLVAFTEAVKRRRESSVAPVPAGAERLGLRKDGSVDDGHAGGCG